MILMYYYYCPVCGFIYKDHINKCSECNTNIPIKKSLHSKNYYTNKAIEEYPNNWNEIDIFYVLHNEEIENNPYFDEEIYDEVCDRKYGSLTTVNNTSSSPSTVTSLSTTTTNQQQQQYTPKCPVCQSPNINKISGLSRAAHGLTFGLFSKTARSQWVCNSCGNKW